MASFNRVTFSGSTDTISVPFGYLDKSHVVVTLDDVVLSSGAYSWPSNGQIKITEGNPAAGVVGEARRVTPATPLVDFEPGNLDTDDLDTASLQAIYIAEEAKDNSSDADARAWYTASFQLGGTIEKGSTDTVPKFDASGNLVPGPSVADVEQAQGYANSAGTAAVNAATSETNASGSATLAGQWASNPEDVEVQPGLFSAFHWYRKTLALYNSVVSGFAGAIHGATSKATLVDADELGLSDSAASWALKKVTLANLVASIFTTGRKIANVNALTSFRLWDTSAPTKGAAFNLTGITAGQTRSVVIPDMDSASGLWEPVYNQAFTAVTVLAVPNLSAYRELRLTLDANSDSSGAAVTLQLSTDNGATYISGAADYANMLLFGQTGGAGAVQATASSFQISGNNTMGIGVNTGGLLATLLLGSFNKARFARLQEVGEMQVTAGSLLNFSSGGHLNNTTARNALRIVFSAASSGRLIVEGIRG